jgi:bifunctional pyridoxal-dependent enzyme with beta-cystathionase and maltose regulon repressor activities
MKHITKFSLAIPGKTELQPQTNPNPQRGTRRLSIDDTIDTMMYGYTMVNDTSVYDQIQHWATEHLAAQEQNYSTILIDSLDIPDLDPAIIESYTDTIERIRRNTR